MKRRNRRTRWSNVIKKAETKKVEKKCRRMKMQKKEKRPTYKNVENLEHD